MTKCFFIANNNIGDFGLSGGDRIFIELARNWSKKIKLTIVGADEALKVCQKEGLKDVNFLKTSSCLELKNVYSLSAILKNFVLKLTRGMRFVLKNKSIFSGDVIIYSVSDFYPDSLPALYIKFINPRAIWIASCFLFAPAPWSKDNPYRGLNFIRGILYWISQKPIYWLIKCFSDFVFVTSEPDKKKFITKSRDASKVVVIRGGVNTEASDEYLNSHNFIPVSERKYDACFVGRFHVQKGVLVLLDIWQEVIKSRPFARLAMIGNGSLEEMVRKQIKIKGLGDNIDLFGFLDGDKKFEIFKQSKIVVHPATFDSGGMAAAEAMCWGLPAISFDLEALKTYYPQGVVKVSMGDIKGFATAITRLLTDKEFYEQIATQARYLIVHKWNWSNRAQEIYTCIMKEA